MTPSSEGEEEAAAAAQQCSEEAGRIACETTPSSRAATGGGCSVSEGRLKRRSGFLETPGVAFLQEVYRYLALSQGARWVGRCARLLTLPVALIPLPEPGRLPFPSEPGCRCQPCGELLFAGCCPTEGSL